MKRWLAVFLVLAGIGAVACYKDDALTHAPAIAPTKVYITDDPFPFDQVSSVKVYVTRIEANTRFDTTGSGTGWVTIATPNKSFDLLTLQQGDTAFVGQSAIDAGKYAAVRMTIDVDQSSIKDLGDSNAVVHWPGTGHGELAFYAGVQKALTVMATGATIVLDFDVGNTFVYNSGARDFTVQQGALRAVISAETGAIAGHVTVLKSGSAIPLPNADVSVYAGGSRPVATARTDAGGAFRVGFLLPGTYAVLVQQPSQPWLAAVTTPNVAVNVGATSNLSVVLPLSGSGSPFIRVTGPDSVSGPSDSLSPYGQVRLHAAVIDSSGTPVLNPSITWIARDSTILRLIPDTPAVAESLSNELVQGKKVGTAWLVVTSGTLADSLLMHVYNPPPPPAGVATVTLTPASLPNLVVGDSVYLVATLRDSSGNIVTNGTIYWNFVYGQDSTVVDIYSFGLQALIRARRTGSTIIQAIEPINYAHADAAVTVH